MVMFGLHYSFSIGPVSTAALVHMEETWPPVLFHSSSTILREGFHWSSLDQSSAARRAQGKFLLFDMAASILFLCVVAVRKMDTLGGQQNIHCIS